MSIGKNIYTIYLLRLIVLFFLTIPIFTFASTTDGTISSSSNQYAWGENVGWINLGTPQGNVHITASGLTGYMWDSIYGWVNLSPTSSPGVLNDGLGNLSGYAWSAGAGFINFSGVVINSVGKFTGQAGQASTTYGRINFDCTGCEVITDWRVSVAPPPPGGGGGGGPYVPPVTPTPTPTPTPGQTVPGTSVPTGTSGTPVTGSGSTTEIKLPAKINLVDIYNNIVTTAKEVFDEAKKLINTKAGSTITKSVSTLGIVTSLAVPLSAITLSDLWLILLRLLGLLLGLLGIKKKSRPWGSVYDSVTKRPLDPVYVSLVNIYTNKEIASAITDLDGRYGFLVVPGTYKIIARKTNYIFPSQKMFNIPFDEVYNDLYHGGNITVVSEGEIITKNIPMDPQGFDWNEFTKNKSNINTFMKGKDVTWAKISKGIFFIGGIVSFIALIFAPAPYNLIIAGFYILAYILNYVVFKTKQSGTLIEKNTNTPLSFAIVKIFREGENTPFIKKIADKFGDYYALVPNGRYFVKIDKKNDDQTYTEILNTEAFDINGGLINMNLVI